MRKLSIQELHDIFSKEAAEALREGWFGPAIDTLEKRAELLVRMLAVPAKAGDYTFDATEALEVARTHLILAEERRRTGAPVGEVMRRLAERGIITLPERAGRPVSLSRAAQRKLADVLGRASDRLASEDIIKDRGD